MEIELLTVGRGAGGKHAAADELLARYAQRIGHFARFRMENFATEERFLAAVDRIGDRPGWKPARTYAKGPNRRCAENGNFAGRNPGRRSAGQQKGTNPAVGRGNPRLLLLDSRGRQHSTEQFADWLQRERDSGVRQIAFAVGPADGWSDAARDRAGMILSLGSMTLPHELAAVVLAEQIYRAFTILENHPYHLGH